LLGCLGLGDPKKFVLVTKKAAGTAVSSQGEDIVLVEFDGMIQICAHFVTNAANPSRLPHRE
jgi:hypothetical protein